MKENMTAEPLPTGAELEGCAVVRAASRHNSMTLIRALDGRIYTTGNHPVHMAENWRASDADRRAFAKLAGIKLSTLTAARKAKATAERKEEAEREMRSLRRLADKHGFKLSKKKPNA